MDHIAAGVDCREDGLSVDQDLNSWLLLTRVETKSELVEPWSNCHYSRLLL